jgi:hypothetical protein
MRGAKLIGVEDILFLMRRDKVYISRITTKHLHSVFATSMDPDQPAQSDQDPCCLLTNPITGRKTDSEQHES